MGDNNSVLTRFFTRNMLQDLIELDESSYELMHRIVRKYSIPSSENATNEQIISDIYHYIDSAYRNEYFYKNTLLNKLIVNVHRVNTTTALTEVPIARSKADFIMINGKAVVYEIKTELDSFDRLSTQLADYYRAFDHVCVVTSEVQLPALQEKLQDSPVGIYVLTKRTTIRRIKEPDIYCDSLDLKYIFKVLNKVEYEKILLKLGVNLPNVTPVKYYSSCKELFCSQSLESVYPLFLAQLKQRNKISITDLSNTPDALHFLLYFSKLKASDAERLHQFLTAQYT